MTTTPQKYKQTEIGSIPDDWEVRTLGDVADIKTGPFGSSLHEKDYVNDGTPIITVEHLSEFGIVYQNMPMVSETDKRRLNAYTMQTNDIVFSRVGSVDRNSMVSEKENGWLFSGRLLRIRINSKNILPKYVSYHFQQETFKQRIRSVAVGQTMASLNTQILKGVKIILPPTKAEQTAIANALNDADALITQLEKLIAKKRQIKQGAMQNLLKPKEGWVEKKLGEVCQIFGRIGFRGYTVNDIVPKEQGAITISPSNIQDKKMDFTKCTYLSWKKYEESPEIKVFNGDILLVKTGSTAGKTALVKNLKEKATVNPQIVVLKKIIIDNVFLSYVMGYEIVQDQIVNTIVGGAIPTLSQKQVANFKITIPKSKEEQIQIAQTLSDMDAEIAGLEQKLDKYRKLKAGMMQNLLTGKIRLV